jgi:hypothetical protein
VCCFARILNTDIKQLSKVPVPPLRYVAYVISKGQPLRVAIMTSHFTRKPVPIINTVYCYLGMFEFCKQRSQRKCLGTFHIFLLNNKTRKQFSQGKKQVTHIEVQVFFNFFCEKFIHFMIIYSYAHKGENTL